MTVELPVARVLALACMGMCLSACSKDKDSEKSLTEARATSAMAALSTSSSPLPRDSSGHLVPHSNRPFDDLAEAPNTRGEPDWDLDAADPARDYVERYVRSTWRYGDKTPCAQAMASTSDGGGRVVEVRDAKRDGCPAPSDVVRDRFQVSVPDDRLHLDGKGDPLKKWPDGSDPEGPPNPDNAREDDVNAMTSNVKAELQKAKLSPIRAQWYGRGSYLVLTVAGWHDPIVRNAPAEKLKPIAEKMCAASGGLPFAVFGGMDRSVILRFRCPDVARWDKL